MTNDLHQSQAACAHPLLVCLLDPQSAAVILRNFPTSTDVSIVCGCEMRQGQYNTLREPLDEISDICQSQDRGQRTARRLWLWWAFRLGSLQL
jgi:hypothetical protein